MFVCKQCGVSKPDEDYYRNKGKRFGKCKECIKSNVKSNREDKQDYYKAYDRNRPNKAERNALNIARQRIGKGRGSHLKSSAKWLENNKKKKGAQTAVSNAVRDGRLTKLPCLVCGEVEVEGHHPNYDAPLDVIWLCVAHHKELHRRYDTEQDLFLLETTPRRNRWDREKEEP